MKSSLVYKLQNYWSYQRKAVGPHALHSPFLFDFYNKVIKPSRNHRLSSVEKLRKELKNNHSLIDLYDLKTNSTYRKTIRSVAKGSLSSRRFSSFLYHLIHWLNAERILETGTSLGINTLYMAGPDCVKRVVSIEASPILATIAQKQVNKLLQHKIDIKQATLQDTLESVIIKEQPELCFLDADHRSEAVFYCVKMIFEHNPKVKCIVLHDIYWSADMTKAWKNLIQDERFPLTIDLFEAGVLFPQVAMAKQHFIIRF